jgi:predicted SAM-dependent methyltransferase
VATHKPSLLNLGCGVRYHPSWVNVDFVANESGVIGHNLRAGIPFEDEKFDVVYHSHLLEHFPKNGALSFLKECYRVTRCEGIIRVVVPDLECIAKIYLEALEKAAQGDKEWEANYEWIKLELFDQVVREHPSGDMAAYLSQEYIPNREFVLGRIGIEGMRMLEWAAQSRNNTSSKAPQSTAGRRLFNGFYRLFQYPSVVREWAIRRILGSEYELLELSRFRRSGEIHLWMYDRYSLACLLVEAGFASPKPVGPSESRIPNWASYHLDTEPDGAVCKPDSLYMEAVKP